MIRCPAGQRATSTVAFAYALALAGALCTFGLGSAAAGSAAAAFARGDYRAAREAWQPQADEGVPTAQYGLGLLYANGWGVERSAPRAQHWYTLAAERGNALAQHNLAVMWQQGQGVPSDVSQAAFWYAEAARQGLAVSAFNIALMSLAGDGVQRSPAAAFDWLSTAAPMDRARLFAALPAATVAVRSANLRAGPGLDAPVVARGRRGRALRLLAREADWVQVWLAPNSTPAESAPVTGWIAARLLDGLPDFADRPLNLARLERGALAGLDAERIARGPSAQLTITRRRASAAEAPATLLRNSGWLVGLDALGDGPGAGRAARVERDRLAVHAAPAAGAAVLIRLARGDRVQVLDDREGWRRVRAAGVATDGWVTAAGLAAATRAEAHASAIGESGG